MCVLGWGVGWRGDGVMVLGKLPVPGRPTKARAYCACGWGCFGLYLLSPIISLLFLPLSWRRPNID